MVDWGFTRRFDNLLNNLLPGSYHIKKSLIKNADTILAYHCYVLSNYFPIIEQEERIHKAGHSPFQDRFGCDAFRIHLVATFSRADSVVTLSVPDRPVYGAKLKMVYMCRIIR